MKRSIVLIWLLFSLCLNAQEGDPGGVQFQENLTWDQIISKAKDEGKYIFVDCFATWCMPCKQMDKYVYPSGEVGKFINEKFISVKVQMDSTKNDGNIQRQWYSVCQKFKKDYRIDAYPTFLFFLPDGKIVHRGSGLRMPDDFLKIAKAATDPKQQLYTQVEKYRENIRDYNLMPDLAKNVYYLLHDKELAFQIASDYANNYLNRLTKNELLKKENIEFITWYPKVLKSNDKYFDLFYKDPDKVDSVMAQVGFASKTVDFIISKEEIYPNIYINGNGKPIDGTPDWNSLRLSIQNKYGSKIAERNILDAQAGWYMAKSDWGKAIKYNIAKIEKNGIDTSFFGRLGINNLCYDLIFKHASDSMVLNKAISWMEQILKFEPDNPSQIDTYAGLLYKVGRNSEAIKWQEKALKLSPEDEEIKEHLLKMKKSEPTWVMLIENN